MTMSTNKSNDDTVPTYSDAYYEAVASQEEIYLEETEEEVRAILVFDDTPASNSGLVAAESCVARELVLEVEEQVADEQQKLQMNLAVEELITGDSDDPPLSEEAIAEMVTNNLNSPTSLRL